jgi:hypothetical protein
MRAVLAAAAAALLLSAGAATAQSCAQETPGVTRCRLVVSEPRSFTVDAGALLAARTETRASLVITVDGRPCLAFQNSRRDRVLASCDVQLTAATHVVEAAVVGATATPRGVGVRLEPSPRLAELPREAATLNPPRRRGFLGWLKR